MNKLYILAEYFTSGFSNITLAIYTVLAIFAGIIVIITKNPIVSVLNLILLFLGISAYLMTLGLNFIGLSYLLVYVGAVSILFIFILMLINIRISEIISSNRNSIPLGILICTLFFYTVNNGLPVTEDFNFSYLLKSLDFYSFALFLYSSLMYIFNNNDTIYDNTSIKLESESLKLAYSHGWDNLLWDSSHITSLGTILYTSFSLWIILVSFVLLLSMVAAILVASKI